MLCRDTTMQRLIRPVSGNQNTIMHELFRYILDIFDRQGDQSRFNLFWIWSLIIPNKKM